MLPAAFRALLQAGTPNPLSGGAVQQAPSSAAGLAASKLRLEVATINNWRGALSASVRQT